MEEGRGRRVDLTILPGLRVHLSERSARSGPPLRREKEDTFGLSRGEKARDEKEEKGELNIHRSKSKKSYDDPRVENDKGAVERWTREGKKS